MNSKRLTGAESRARLRHAFPKAARKALRNADPLTDVGPSVQEIRIAYSKETYRVIYIATLGTSVFMCYMPFTRRPSMASRRQTRSWTWHADVTESL
jgi:phage-related protein